MVFSWVNWGLGLIIGAVLAKTIGIEFYKQRRPLHYPVVCAAGYAGLGLIWHWGLSASAPPLSNTRGHAFQKLFEELFGRGLVLLDETIFHPYTISLSIIMIICATVIFWVLAPRGGAMKGIDVVAPHVLEAELREEEKAKEKRVEKWTIADRLKIAEFWPG